MSQVSQATLPLTTQVRSPRRALWLGALLVLAAVAAVVLVLALDGGSPKTDTAGTADIKAQPSARTDGGPEESHVAASVGSRPTAGPDEARIAGSIGRATPEVTTGPDESRTAATISGR